MAPGAQGKRLLPSRGLQKEGPSPPSSPGEMLLHHVGYRLGCGRGCCIRVREDCTVTSSRLGIWHRGGGARAQDGACTTALGPSGITSGTVIMNLETVLSLAPTLGKVGMV